MYFNPSLRRVWLCQRAKCLTALSFLFLFFSRFVSTRSGRAEVVVQLLNWPGKSRRIEPNSRPNAFLFFPISQNFSEIFPSKGAKVAFHSQAAKHGESETQSTPTHVSLAFACVHVHASSFRRISDDPFQVSQVCMCGTWRSTHLESAEVTTGHNKPNHGKKGGYL